MSPETPPLSPDNERVFRTLLGYQHPKREKLDRIIKDVGSLDLLRETTWLWEMVLLREAWPEIKSFCAELVRDRPLIDLGGGYGTTMEQIARELGASMYVNVDKFAFDAESSKKDEIETFRVKADLLDFVSHMKNDSANFTINGIDRYIIPSNEYHRALAEELGRTTLPNGIVLGAQSMVLDYLEENGFRVPPELPTMGSKPEAGIGVGIFQKVSSEDEREI
jgi:hypothetical protein